MIESTNTNELQGQYELDDLLPRNEVPREQEWPEGYDAEGHLMNEDYPPLQKPSPVGGPQALASLRASGGTAQAVTEEVSDTPTTANAPTDPTAIPMNPQTSADAARLTALATEIKVITEQTRATVISAALAVGKRLIEAKSICPAGRWLEWLETAVAYSERKAQDMMRLYLEYGRDGSIPDSIAALDYSKAVALLAAPAEAREALAEQAQADELSVRELQQEIRRLKDENAKAQQTIFNQDYTIKRAQREMEGMREEQANTLANLKASRDVNERMEGEHQDEIEAKDAELRETKRVLAEAAEKISLAQAKAAAAEASAEQLKRLRAEAEERADKNSQNYRDALKRANDTAKELAAAKAKLQALSEAAATASANGPEVQTVEVVPESVQRELEQLKRDLAEARATRSGDYQSPPSPAPAATAAEKFKWFYQNQMQPTFKTALTLLKEVAQEDGHAADAFATAITNACKVLMNQLGS